MILGSGGCLFSNFIRKAIYDKISYEIVSVDKVKKTSVLNNLYANSNHKFYIADIADKHVMNVIFEFERPDIVIHGADENDCFDLINSNIAGTYNIVDLCKKWNIEKLIYISSYEVYGQLKNEDLPWKEDSLLDPNNFYAASKASAELFIKASDIDYNIIRLSNNYGPRQSVDKFIPKVINNILQNKNVSIYGLGNQTRDFIHVQDNCNAIVSVLLNGKNKEIYNVGGFEFSIIETFHQICNSLEKGHELLEFVEPPKNNIFRRASDNSKIKELGWKPIFKFKDGINSSVKWYLNNKWFLSL